MEQIERTIFVGPSLYGVDFEIFPGERWLGPARAGDVYRIARDLTPCQIVLIDGIFYHDLAVWHKELIFAMLQGIVCIGAASMGALRAAELCRYGMIGVGEIFERYRDGEEDDSLVALSFDPETYRPLEDPPISNIQKQRDAMQSIEFARGYKERVKTTLTAEAFGEYLQAVLDKL